MNNIDLSNLNPTWDEERKAVFIPIINKYLDAKHSETEMTWDYAMEYAKQAGKELPSQHEMFALLFFKDEINKILDAHGGDFLNEYAWTSSEIPAGMVSLVNFNTGSICFFRKTDYNYAYTIANV